MLQKMVNKERGGEEMMKKCMVILNPSSGKEQVTIYEAAIRAQLADYEVMMKKTTGGTVRTRHYF